MKLAALRRNFSGSRAALALWQVAFSIAAIVLTWQVGLVNLAGPQTAELLALVMGVWVIGWAFGPMLYGGEDKTLQPEIFRSLPVSHRRLAASLAIAAVAGITVPVSLLAFAILLPFSAQFGVIPVAVGLGAIVLQTMFVILLCRVVTGFLRIVTTSQVSALLSSAVTGAVMAFFITGWWIIGGIGDMLQNGLPDWLSQLVLWLPSGWSVGAITAAAQGDWLLAAALLAGLVLLVVGLWLAWSILLRRRLTTPAARSVLSGHRSSTRTALTSPLAAVVFKERLTWRRDYTRASFVYFALFYSVFICVYPSFVGVLSFLPLMGILFVINAAGTTANAYGADGSALWQTMVTPHAAAVDVRGRQYAWLLMMAPVAVGLSVAGTIIAGMGALWPAIAGLTLAGIGGAAGVMAFMSVWRPLPMTDPRLRGDDMFEHGIDWAQFMISLLLSAVCVAPVILLLWGGMHYSWMWAQWVALPLGLVIGVAATWFFGTAATYRLQRRSPELLNTLRKGRAVQEQPAAAQVSVKEMAVRAVLFCASPVLLFPQGIVPAIFKLTGQTNKAWFLPLYLPDAWQWPAIAVAITAGASLFAYAYARFKRTQG